MTPRVFRTGFCNPASPDWAHQRCREQLGGVLDGNRCGCDCHTEPPPAYAAPEALDVTAIEERVAAVRAETWNVVIGEHNWSWPILIVPDGPEPGPVEPTQAFLAHARNDIDLLLAEIHRLRGDTLP